MLGAIVEIVDTIVELDGFVPIIFIRLCIKSVISCGLCRTFFVRTFVSYNIIKLKRLIGAVVEVISRIESFGYIIILT